MIEQRKIVKILFLCFGGLAMGGILGGLVGCDREHVAEPPPADVDPAYLEAASRQNDTGILFSGNHPRTVNDICLPGEIDHDDEWLMGETFEESRFFGQDCELGRDATHAAQTDAHGGFSFVKVSAEGDLLLHDAEEWACVLDQVTGLMWESKSLPETENVSLHGADDVFSWYNTDANTNGGNIGDWNQNRADCAGYEAGNPATFCNSQAFAERVNEQALCGYSDWRIPDLRELTSIINFGRTQPAAETTYFPQVRSEAYWVSSTTAASPDLARWVNFKFGLTGVGLRIDRNRVLLVRSHNP